ncbi:N-acetylglucosamine-6-phosphate deacetylase [Butyrivibrio sp. MC2013]|uniref:N-acetylglucosamine-6-phosphate deacetylase n=1 Tax=Butyrivibrio sp. MC2013 TaxID=1280686 RepID=UPI000409845B|nr:N-acetylglucosamine-6-phosphate deacetylase [Butyrivibrio sp. MC2013]
MKIINGLVYTDEGVFKKGCVEIKDGRILGVSLEEGLTGCISDCNDILDAEGNYVIPGLVDVHVHGCHNRDFCDADMESISDFLAYEASLGVTALCPTTMTVPEERLLSVARETGKYLDDLKADPTAHMKEAVFAGINMEGPFISPAKKGSQEESDIKRADSKFVEEMQKLSGDAIKLVDIAPEMDGAMEFIDEMKDKVVISIAHTNADYDTCMKAISKGVHHITHLYNAMSPYTHRAPGVIGAASDDPESMVELITDGFHIHPCVVRNTFRIFGPERVVLISDSMRAIGMPDGEYELGGHKVTVTGRKALLADGTIAASVTNLYDCMKVCINDMGIAPEIAIRAASLNPAVSIGLDNELGSITPGKIANILIADKNNFDLKAVVLKGQKLS